MTLGERIKELRKKNDLTQEKLADYLCVSYQAVSKWECGLSNPDLTLLVPLAKILKVSTDELLGMTEKEADKRYQELEVLHEETYKTGDLAVRIQTSETAVKEYPGDMKWMNRYAWDIWFQALEEKEDAVYEQWREKAIHYFAIVIENTNEEEIKEHAVTGIVQCLCAKGCKQEAKKYVDLLPDAKAEPGQKNTLLGMCLEGEKQLRHKQKYTEAYFGQLVTILLWDGVAEKKYTCDAAEGMIKAMIPDGNYGSYHAEMSHIQFRKAEVALQERQGDYVVTALEYVKKAAYHARQYDLLSIVKPGEYTFTAPIFSKLTFDSREWCHTGNDSLLNDMKKLCERECFDVIRGSEEFQAIFR